MAENFFSGLAEGLQSGQAIKAKRQDRADRKEEFNAKMAMEQDQFSQQMNLKNQEFGMKKELFNIQKEDRQMELSEKQRQKSLMEGLNTAFASGGYESAIDYLKGEDMGMYMSVTKAKNELDQSILSTAKAESLTKREQIDTTQAGHTLLGRFGASILKVPANERARAYQQMLPVLKSINPDIPDTYTQEAQNKLLISMGVSMPDSVLYGTDKAKAASATAIGKISSDIQKMQDSGMSSDDPSMVALKNQLNAEIQSSAEANLTAAKNAKGEDGLRNQYLQLNKEFMTTRDAFNNIKSYSSDPKVATTAGDMKLIYAYNKMLDPNSTVREGEYATVKNAGSWDDRSRAQYNAALKGTLLSDKVRGDYLDNARGIYNAKKEGYSLNQKNFTDIAVRRGVDPKNVVIDLLTEGQSGQSQGAPSEWIQQVRALNPTYSEADANAAWEYTQKQAQQPQQAPPQQGGEQQQEPVGEGNPPWQANRSMF